MSWIAILALDRDEVVASQAGASAANLRLALTIDECQPAPCGRSHLMDQAASRMWTSVPQIVVVAIRIRTSVTPTSGIGLSLSRMRPGSTKNGCLHHLDI